MRYLVALSILAGLGWLGMHQVGREDTAQQVMDKAVAMERMVGDEAGEVGYAVVAARFPFSSAAVDARRRLFELKAAGAGGFAVPAILRDAVWTRGDPFVGGLTPALLAVLIALHALLQPGGRARGRAFLLLLLAGGGIALTQTRWGHGVLAERGAVDVYAAFPWIAAGALVLAAFLLTVARRQPRRA